MTRDRDARSSKPRPHPEGTKGRAWWGNSCDVLAESDDRRRSCLSTKEKNFLGRMGRAAADQAPVYNSFYALGL